MFVLRDYNHQLMSPGDSFLRIYQICGGIEFMLAPDKSHSVYDLKQMV